MGFKSENRTIQEIFYQLARFDVPRYQRAYVWSEINWSELLTDITFTMNTEQEINWSHFLGTIVLSDISSKVANREPAVKYYEIIDGQQRMTTVYVIFSVICRRYLEIDTKESIASADFVLPFLTTRTSNSQQLLKIGNEELDFDLKEMVDFSTELEKDQLPANNQLSKVFNFYYKKLSVYNHAQLENFMNKLIQINVVEIISGEEEEIYNIFEVLNARGQKLKQFELLKNHIMKYITPRTNRFIDETKETWAKLVENTSSLNDRDILLNHFVRCYIKKTPPNADSIYKLIKEEIPINELPKLLKDLSEFSVSYMEIYLNEKKRTSVQYFGIKRNQQIRSLLASVMIQQKRGKISEQTMEETFNNIRNFFFIFNGMQKTSNRIDKDINEFSHLVYSCVSEVDFKFIMSEFFNKMNKFVDRESFIVTGKANRSFRYSNKDAALKRNGTLLKYILIELTTIKQKDVELRFDNLSIEHLVLDSGDQTPAYIGNLTIVPPDFNRERLGNKPIQEKIQILNNESSFNINKNLEKYLTSENFDIEKRTEDIISTLFDEVFKFNSNLYHITETQILEYKDNIKLVEGDEELLYLLKNKGKYFVTVLKSNPDYKTLNERYLKLLT